MTKTEIIEKAVKMFRSIGKVDVARIASEEGIRLVALEAEDEFNAQLEYDENEDRFTIKTNLNHPETRVRFSLAHELAHYILHRQDVKSQKLIKRTKGNYGDPKQERQANELASEILMPEVLIREECKVVDIGSGAIVSPEVIDRLAKKFNVSKQAMAIRLEQLKYSPVLTHVL